MITNNAAKPRGFSSERASQRGWRQQLAACRCVLPLALEGLAVMGLSLAISRCSPAHRGECAIALCRADSAQARAMVVTQFQFSSPSQVGDVIKRRDAVDGRL
jgi:hypothetical protein